MALLLATIIYHGQSNIDSVKLNCGSGKKSSFYILLFEYIESSEKLAVKLIRQSLLLKLSFHPENKMFQHVSAKSAVFGNELMK